MRARVGVGIPSLESESTTMKRRSFLLSSLGLTAAFAAGTHVRAATSATDIIRVEEDWYIKVGDPDPDIDAPQIVTVFGPVNPITGTHAIFELNHGTQPDFAQGGMQLQCWYANSLVGYRSQHAPAELNVVDEVIKFTTASEIILTGTDRVLMEVIDGTSTSWGTFGGIRSLRLSIPTSLDDLNSFDPAHSIANSRVTFGGNRVIVYKRTAIRYYDGAGLHQTDTTDTVVEAW